MRKILTSALAALLALPALSACQTAYTGPVEVTRFTAPERDPLAERSVRLVAADGEATLQTAPYVEAVARELAQLGYTVDPAGEAALTARWRVERFPLDERRRRSPVSVGAGGSTGSYGSGVGLGVGINLGGSAAPDTATELSVSLRDAAGNPVWEGRAELLTSRNSNLAPVRENADALARGLFNGFPGESGETVQIRGQ